MVDANNVQYQLLLNNLPHAFSYQKLITDGEGKAVDCIFLEVNDAFEKLTGLARDRVIGKRLTEITLGAKKLDHNWLKTCSKAALTGQSISFEQNCESDNSWQEVTAYSDKTGYFAAIFRDITAGREKERVLREIGAKEQVILNAFPDMVFLCDNEGFFLDYYTTDRNLLAEEPEKFLGKSVWEVLPKKMAEKYMHCSQIAQKTQQPQVIEYDLEVLGGVRFFEARITPLDEKKMLAIVRNITERKETERALRESEEKYRSLVENLNEIVYVLNEKAEIVYVSPNIEAIGGYTVSEVQGRRFTDFVHEEDKNGRMEQFYKIFSGINEATEYRFVTKDGDTIWMRTAARPIVEEGQVVGIQGVLTDITDRKERDKRLRDQRAKIEALHHVSLKMENCDDEEEICNLTVEAAEEILNFTYGKVGLVEGDWIRVKATSPGFEQEDIPANVGLAGRTLRKGKSIVVDDVQEDEDAQPFRRNYRGAVSIPIGNLGVFQAVSHKKKAFNAEDVEMAELLVAHTLAAIKRIRRDKELAESQKRLNTLLTQTPAVIYSCQIVNGETLITYISENIKNVLGFEPQDFIGNFDFWQKQVHPDDAKGLASKNPMTFKEDRVTREEYRFRDREGNYRWLHDEHRFIVGEEGNMEVVGAWWDITDRKEMEETLIESENKYRMLVSNVPGAVFRCKNDPEWTMEYINEEIEEITGYPASDFMQNKVRTYASVIHGDDRQVIYDLVQEGIREKRQCKLDYRIVHSDGSIRWINENVQGVFNNQGELLYLIGIINDVTQLKQAEEALKESEEKYRQVFDYAPLGVVHIDSNGEITDCNDNFVEIIGSSREELIGLDTLNLQDERIVRRITDALQGKLTTFEGDYHSTTADKVTPARVLFAPIKSDDENVVGVIGIVEDIAERKKAEEKIRYMGFHDTLTGLYNRAFLEEEMRRLDTERQLPISIIMADLNGLKLVNDTYGHAKGDEMLKRTAEILRKPCREEDIIARWGGDEFVILIPQTRGEEANKICKRIMKSCKSAYVNDVPISIALGFACKDSSEKELSQVLREAEDNMYQHKLTEDRSAKNAVLKALLKTLAEKSFETEGHVFNMQRIAQVIGQKLDLPDSELSRLELIITLHDIGKINISEEVLTKEGLLTREEWEIIKRHPEIGYRIARATAEFAHVAEDILAHHERWDGSGYPRGLKGKDIPLLARITAIADAYEVMRYGRPYKKAMDKSEIIEEFKRCSASQFDPELVAIFLSILAEGKID